jgi:hypothetical protein
MILPGLSAVLPLFWGLIVCFGGKIFREMVGIMSFMRRMMAALFGFCSTARV